jgi:hypothetical protein
MAMSQPSAARSLAFTMASTKPCPPLPFELWGKVLSNIDDPFDLWTTCRQISNGIRIEAERTFRLIFLPDLRIKWSITRNSRYCEHIYLDIRAKPSHALVDAISSSATFTIQVNGPVSSSSGYIGWSNKERNECVRQAFHYKDHNATTRTIRHEMRVFFETQNVFATYQNDPGISGLGIHLTPFQDQFPIKAWEDRGHISFDWKKLMTSFFSEEIWVRGHSTDVAVNKNRPPSLARILQDFEDRLRIECPSLKIISKKEKRCYVTLAMKRSEEAAFHQIERDYIAAVSLACAPDRTELYWEAHRKRLMKAHPKQDIQDELGNESVPNLSFYAYVHVRDLYNTRVRSVEDMAEKYWRKEVGAVWHTITEDGSSLIPDSDSDDDR